MAATKREKLGTDTEVSVAELAALLGLSADRIYQLIRGGILQTVKRTAAPGGFPATVYRNHQ